MDASSAAWASTVLAFLIFLVQVGLPVLNIEERFWFGVVVWSLFLVLCSYAIWVLGAKLATPGQRISAILVFAALVNLLIYPRLEARYRQEHPRKPAKPSIPALPTVKVKPVVLPLPSYRKVTAAVTEKNTPTKDKIEITLEQTPDQTFVFLSVKNRGDDAIFWATLKTPAPVAGPSGQVVFAQWEHHIEDEKLPIEKSTISHNRTHRLIIGRLDNGSDASFSYYTMITPPLLATWVIPYTIGGKVYEARSKFPTILGGVGFPPLVVTVTIFTDPPMREGPIDCRVSLETARARLLT
jgi:hypothetical protein